VSNAIGNAQIVFGLESSPISAAQCLYDGQRYFSKATSSPGAVGIVMTNDRPTVEVVLGAIAAGASLVSLPLPPRSADRSRYLDLLRGACRAEGAEQIVASDSIVSQIAECGLKVVAHSALASATLHSVRGTFQLIQFSSGSTAVPKAVGLDDQALGANITATLERIEPSPGDVTLSWLPLSHDMGLIGMLLTCVCGMSRGRAGGGTVVLLDPAQFLRKPDIWLRAIETYAATVTAAPGFGYRLCLDRHDTELRDLSSLRCAIVGGEIVRSSTLARFADRFAENGFRRRAFSPAYGLAELGLAASMTPMTSSWRELRVRTSSLADREVVERPDAAGASDQVTTLVSSGPPLPGYEVHCKGGAGRVGSVLVRGPSVGVDRTTSTSFANDRGWLQTGDLGTMIDGWLYVVGRNDDHIVTLGRNIYAPSVEEVVGALKGVRAGRVAALGLPSGDWIIAVEPAWRGQGDESQARELVTEIRRRAVSVSASSPSAVALVTRGSLPYTPSGKLRRREALRRYLAGELRP
jgi:fatty-acyl-CoA synthase